MSRYRVTNQDGSTVFLDTLPGDTVSLDVEEWVLGFGWVVV